MAGFVRPSVGEKFDPAAEREGMRGWLAMLLVLLVVGEIVGSFYIAVQHPEVFENIKELLGIVFGASTTLLGTVVGFYFGEKSGFGKSDADG